MLAIKIYDTFNRSTMKISRCVFPMEMLKLATMVRDEEKKFV